MTENMKILYLCGFMGSGKTVAGKIAAEKLKLPFIDLDNHIEKEQNRSVADTFAAHGEHYFRILETSAISAASENFNKNNSGGIIALGGGAVVKPENIIIINNLGVLVYIDVDFDICYERIKADPNRPIAKDKTKEELESLYLTRKQIYLKNAKYTINGNTSLENLSERIVKVYADL
jgi:shikimate kinase